MGFGDFNLLDISWPDGVAPNGQGIETRQAKALLSFMNTHFMTQMTEGPTHGPNCLDLVMTNNTSLISSIGIEKNDVSLSDHNTLKVVTMIRPGKREKVDISRDFYTTTINRYNLKDGTETIGVNTKMCYPKMTGKVLLYSSVPLKRLNIFKNSWRKQ